MPQEMNVLRCFSCKMYQVHMIKQAKKWQCKVCNHKQTFKQVYFRGSAKDCRTCVQKLNLMKADENQTTEFFYGDSNVTDNYSVSYSNHQLNSKKVENKWAKYLDTSEDTEFNTSEFFNSEINSYEKSEAPMYVHNDNTTYECSQNNYVNTDSNSSYENDSKQDLGNSKEEYDHVEQNETLDNINNSDNNSQNYNETIIDAKSTNSIFDDNEDFDVSIDF